MEERSWHDLKGAQLGLSGDDFGWAPYSQAGEKSLERNSFMSAVDG